MLSSKPESLSNPLLSRSADRQAIRGISLTNERGLAVLAALSRASAVGCVRHAG